MTTDQHPTDEPDGTTAHQASLRPPGHSLDAPADPGGDAEATDVDTAGYDADAVSGGTSEYRPD